MNRFPVASLFAVIGCLSIGCRYDEGLVIEDFNGTVVIPGDLITRTYNVDGTPTDVADARTIGAVYLGLYSGAVGSDVVTTYPHPAVGPAFDGSTIGNTYPYGGTTIGQMRPVCLEALNCKMVSGRFTDYDALLSWFSDYLGAPVLDWYDQPVESGQQLRELCMATFDYTRDDELGFVASDVNGDGEVTEADLDFVDRGDGNFEAEFTIRQQDYYTNPEGTTGFTLFGMVDNAAAGSGEYGSCQDTSQIGQFVTEYSERFRSGTMLRNVLNRPSSVLSSGDLVSGPQDQEGGTGDVGYIYQDVYDTPELWLNTEVQ